MPLRVRYCTTTDLSLSRAPRHRCLWSSGRTMPRDILRDPNARHPLTLILSASVRLRKDRHRLHWQVTSRRTTKSSPPAADKAQREPLNGKMHVRRIQVHMPDNPSSAAALKRSGSSSTLRNLLRLGPVYSTRGGLDSKHERTAYEPG